MRRHFLLLLKGFDFPGARPSRGEESVRMSISSKMPAVNRHTPGCCHLGYVLMHSDVAALGNLAVFL
jgi:hypothetical protein